jgi:hypothetical protein
MNGSNFGGCQGSKEKEIRRTLSQPLQTLRQATRFFEKVPTLPPLF